MNISIIIYNQENPVRTALWYDERFVRQVSEATSSMCDSGKAVVEEVCKAT